MLEDIIQELFTKKLAKEQKIPNLNLLLKEEEQELNKNRFFILDQTEKVKKTNETLNEKLETIFSTEKIEYKTLLRYNQQIIELSFVQTKEVDVEYNKINWGLPKITDSNINWIQ